MGRNKMEYKTLEELFIDRFEQLENENQKLREQLEESEKKDASSDEDVIKISDHTGVFYCVSRQNYYHYNDVLKDNGCTPELIKNALSDEDAFTKFMNMERKDSWWHPDKVGGVGINTYQYLLRTADHTGVLTYNPTSSTPFNMFNIDDETYFLDKEKAEEMTRVKVMNEIKLYFKNKCDEEFTSESVS